MSEHEKPGFARRDVIKMIAAAAVAPLVLKGCGESSTGVELSAQNWVGPAGTLTDPNLVNPVVPWRLTLTVEERQTLASLCDVIIPSDDQSPAASSLGTHEFIDEWVSAPYEKMKEDRVLVREGIEWLNQESEKRFGALFQDIMEEQKILICDDISYIAEAAPGFETGARFFDKVRDLTAAAFYTTREGMADIAYVGNVPLKEWLPPPVEVLRHVGLDTEHPPGSESSQD